MTTITKEVAKKIVWQAIQDCGKKATEGQVAKRVFYYVKLVKMCYGE